MTQKKKPNHFTNKSKCLINISQFECCGITSTTDWIPIFGDEYLPPSCCQLPVEQATSCTEKNASKTGCEELLLDYLRSMFTIFTLIAVIVLLIQVDDFFLFFLLLTNQFKYLIFSIAVHWYCVCLLLVSKLVNSQIRSTRV